MSDARSKYPRLTLPFTLIPAGDRLHLIHGEDVRYSLNLGPLVAACHELLAKCDGSRELNDLLPDVSPDQRRDLETIVARLYGERLLADGPVEAAHRARVYSVQTSGRGPLVERLRDIVDGTNQLHVFCQDMLDYNAMLQFNRERLMSRDAPWLWVTTGPVSRGFVSPIILPNAGPCLECLWRNFRRLSPVADLYEAHLKHAEAGGTFAASNFPASGLALLEQIVGWKIEQLNEPRPSLAIYRLHVLELASMEVKAYRVHVDPCCPACQVDDGT